MKPHPSCYNLHKTFIQETKRMNLYVTGNTIKQLREQKKMTQAELADKIDVSSKTISKWEDRQRAVGYLAP